MGLNTTGVGLAISAISTVVGLAEKYGTEIYDTVIDAIKELKSTTGPTTAEIDAIFAKCKADNDAIQAM